MGIMSVKETGCCTICSKETILLPWKSASVQIHAYNVIINITCKSLYNSLPFSEAIHGDVQTCVVTSSSSSFHTVANSEQIRH